MLGLMLNGMDPIWIEENQIRIRSFLNHPFLGIKAKDLCRILGKDLGQLAHLNPPGIDPFIVGNR